MPALIPLLPVAEKERRKRRANSGLQELWDLLDEVKDPEIPVISIWELGILQDIEWQNEAVVVTITPTYSGCPAMHEITEDIGKALSGAGYPHSEVVTRLFPAWTTDWLTDDARDKFRTWGIAPPGVCCAGRTEKVACPLCSSTDVAIISEFGSTACKALYRCGACLEPFDHFKAI